MLLVGCFLYHRSAGGGKSPERKLLWPHPVPAPPHAAAEADLLLPPSVAFQPHEHGPDRPVRRQPDKTPPAGQPAPCTVRRVGALWESKGYGLWGHEATGQRHPRRQVRSRLQLVEVWQPYALHDFNVQGCTRTNSIQSSWSMYTVNSHKQVMYAHRVTPDQRMN